MGRELEMPLRDSCQGVCLDPELLPNKYLSFLVLTDVMIWKRQLKSHGARLHTLHSHNLGGLLYMEEVPSFYCYYTHHRSWN